MTGLYVFIAVVAVISLIVAIWVALYFENGVAGVATLILCLAISGFASWVNWATTYQNDHWAVCTVTDKDRGGDNGSYRIYTEDCGQLANVDSVLRAKYDSADIWQEIPDEGVVKLRIAGVRNGFFSQFPNVFDVQEVQVLD